MLAWNTWKYVLKLETCLFYTYRDSLRNAQKTLFTSVTHNQSDNAVHGKSLYRTLQRNLSTV
jgi:hypothetical protein